MGEREPTVFEEYPPFGDEVKKWPHVQIQVDPPVKPETDRSDHDDQAKPDDSSR